ncbi:DUF485 domain-containing protein [Bacillus sp. BPN334]|uniref:DUF485 domain-containing protein n=1 Tax=Bacillus sp. BPN334 TaxID=2217815 RepID=UPI00351A3349
MKRDDTSARKLQNEVNYTEVVQSEEFQLLLNTKKKFIVPMSIFFLSFFIALPILTSYSKVLNTPAFGDVTWAWVFAYNRFCTIFNHRSWYTRHNLFCIKENKKCK